MIETVARLAAGKTLTSGEWQQLKRLALQDTARARAFGMTAATVEADLQARSHWLSIVYPSIDQFCQRSLGASINCLETLWHLWLPLALWLATQRQTQNRPWIQGILGGQGTGKTTLGAILTLILQALGYKTISFSLDDLYKTHEERLQLRKQDPRLRWRGPPGTHDIELGVQTLEALRHPTPATAIAIPRFDKSLHHGSGDRTAPEWVTDIDIVLFEGWFVGARPLDPMLFEAAIAPLVTAPDRPFACAMNAQLHAYQPLWERLDRLIVLYPKDYRLSQTWRKQAEQQMRTNGKPGMSDAEIDAFVAYFWTALHPELFIKPLVTQTNGADLVIEIQADHSPGAVYKSGDRSR